jgi:hypothetical protein
MEPTPRTRLFYRFVLPCLTLCNLTAGVAMLFLLQPADWLHWMELASGALCCTITGLLLGVAWSRSLWEALVERQVWRWRRIVDALFGWIEEIPISSDEVRRLKRSLDETLVSK